MPVTLAAGETISASLTFVENDAVLYLLPDCAGTEAADALMIPSTDRLRKSATPMNLVAKRHCILVSICGKMQITRTYQMTPTPCR